MWAASMSDKFPRLSKQDIIRRLFRRFSSASLSPQEKMLALKRLITRLTTSQLSDMERKAALMRLIWRITKK